MRNCPGGGGHGDDGDGGEDCGDDGGGGGGLVPGSPEDRQPPAESEPAPSHFSQCRVEMLSLPVDNTALWLYLLTASAQAIRHFPHVTKHLQDILVFVAII